MQCSSDHGLLQHAHRGAATALSVRSNAGEVHRMQAAPPASCREAHRSTGCTCARVAPVPGGAGPYKQQEAAAAQSAPSELRLHV
jgi:hypothetical protein